MAQEAKVRFYFDADILGLAHVICGLRNDCTYPGDPGAVIKRRLRRACPISTPRATKDREWIPVVAQSGWVAITRDSNIMDHVSLLELINEHGLRLIALSGKDGRDPWGQLEIVLSHWRRIEAVCERRGPLLLVASRTSLRQVDISERLDVLRGLRTQPARKRKSDAQAGEDTPQLW
ncbi:hypothetical protein [Mycobacterium marinum]|uniref:PIN-like domain-containing protein n=1 Tax=Mycobacterium marinum TaxID=1781 RepID=UPI00356AAD77